jgi:hypothetical protein
LGVVYLTFPTCTHGEVENGRGIMIGWTIGTKYRRKEELRCREGREK